VSQQKLAQPLTCSLLVLFGVFPRSYQIAQCFVRRIGNPHRRQIAIAITPRQLLGIPPVGLDPIARFGRHQRRRDHLAAHAQLCQLPIQNVPGRTRFVAGFQLLHRTQLCHRFANRFQAVRDHPRERTSPFGSATAIAIVPAWTSKPINRILDMRPIPFVCGSAPPVSTLRSVTRASAKDWSLHFD
jgi:hypothetical protein